jgi:hypothetical protein
MVNLLSVTTSCGTLTHLSTVSCFLRFCRKNGDPFVNLLSITPIHDARGTLTHYVGIQSDITELVNHKKAELAARHAALQVRYINFIFYVQFN